MKKEIINTKKILDFIKDKKLTEKEFCNMCNISTSILRKIKKRQYNFRISHIINIANTIGTKKIFKD